MIRSIDSCFLLSAPSTHAHSHSLSLISSVFFLSFFFLAPSFSVALLSLSLLLSRNLSRILFSFFLSPSFSLETLSFVLSFSLSLFVCVCACVRACACVCACVPLPEQLVYFPVLQCRILICDIPTILQLNQQLLGEMKARLQKIHDQKVRETCAVCLLLVWNMYAVACKYVQVA